MNEMCYFMFGISFSILCNLDGVKPITSAQIGCTFVNKRQKAVEYACFD